MLKSGGKDKKAKLSLDISSSESDSEDESDKIQQKRKGKGKLKDGFTINKNYAERYNNWRNLEEMQKLKSRLGVNDVSELKEEESSSESSEEEEEWSEEKEKAFLKTLACLKKKDPKIYSGQFGFFNEGDAEAINQDAPKKKKEGKKPFTVRDHERTMVLENGGELSDNETEQQTSNGKSKKVSKSYPEELASIKTAFSKALNEIDSSDDEDQDNLLGSNLLKRRANKSAEENEKEKEDYKLWLKGELEKVEKGKLSKDDVEELKSLREYWNDDKLDEGEKFLRDYILNQKYIDPLSEDEDYIPSYNEVVHDDDDLSNDEKFENEREEFEHKYNFRFEEPDQDFIKRYPRTIQDSMRREDAKRKEQRQKAKERKEETKARHKEEVQRLKALKRKEIMDKIQRLHEITGDPDLNVSEKDIDGDFDPAEYDRRMQQIFDDKYYQEEADDEKPVFEYDPELDDEEKWDRWVPPREAASGDLEENELEDNDEDGDSNDEEKSEFFGRKASKAAAQQELIQASKGKRNRRKRSAFLEALEREKPKFDPKVHKSFEKYFEEYYNLDFEDVVGDVKCRFKYHKTTPNDFGLTTDEILKAQDKELNQWASIKKTFQYRGEDEEQYEVKAYKEKAARLELKKSVLSSVYQTLPENDADDDQDDGENEQKKKKRKKKNKKKNKIADVKIEKEDEDTIELEQALVDNKSSPKKTKKDKKKKGHVKMEKDGEDTTEQDEAVIDNEPSPKKSKKDKKKKADIAIEKEEETTECADKHSPRKAKKKKQEGSNESVNDKEDASKSRQNQPTKKISEVDSSEPKLSKRQRKNRKRLTLTRSENGEVSVTTPPAAPPNKTPVVANGDTVKKSKNKHFDKEKRGMKRKATNTEPSNGIQVDEDRLRAYGLNPKKFKKQMKYGGSAAKA